MMSMIGEAGLDHHDTGSMVRSARPEPQPCTCGLVIITCVCDDGCMLRNQKQRSGPWADEDEPDTDRFRLEEQDRHDQIEAQLTRTMERRAARPGSEPGAQSVSVAVAALECDEVAHHVRRTWRGSDWHPVRVGLAVTATIACFGLIALMHFEQVPTFESPTREPVAIDRVIEFKGGATVIGHGERVGDTIWLHLLEFNWSERARPAAALIEDADKAAEDSGADSADDIPVARPIAKMAEDRPVVPARSIRRRVIPVKKPSTDKSVFFKVDSTRGKAVRAVPLHSIQ